MAQWQKFLDRLLSGKSDNNLNFDDVRNLLKRLGFTERIRGSHHVYERTDLPELVDIQTLKDGKAKAYQIAQIRDLFRKHNITTV